MDLSPKQIVNQLDKYIIGQDEAKKAVAIALRNRYRRAQLSPEIREEITPKNIIMKGPTGVGKTEIARRLAKLVKAPFVKVEATKYTEVGYVGKDVEGMIRDLAECAYRLVKAEKEEEVKAKWDKLFASRKAEGGERRAQCPVLGETLPVARLHNKIKGIRNGQPSGCSLVCFNNASENSYGKEQSYNSSVSEEAMEQYTEALNFLLADERHCTVLGDMTIVHFALAAEEDAYLDCVNTSLFARTDRATAEDVDKAVANTMHKIASGRTPSFDVPDVGVDYCIFGLMPNTSRVAIKFSYRNTFDELRKNVERYQEEFAIGKRTQAPPVWAICKQLVSPKAKENAAPELEGDILHAIVSGSPFPRKILEAVVRRVRVDSDPENNHFVKLNDVRAGLIKVCLSRKIKEEEKITMALNPQNKNAAYLCGRLFAVLEKVQQDSASGELNKTIKDSYFASACATPAVVFARLVQLSQNHLAKLEKGMQIYYNKLLGEIIGDLEEFPKALSLEEQGKFILGYYQQNAALYTKKENQSEGK